MKKSLIKKYGSIFYLRIGQVKNGPLYIRYRNNSPKYKAEELKKLTDYFLYYSKAISTPKVPLTFNEFEKPNLKVSILFIFFLLLSFVFHRHNTKSIRSLQILSILNDCLANLLLPILVLSFV